MRASRCLSLLAVIMLLGLIMMPGCKPSQKTAYINPDDEDSLGGTGIDSGDVRTVCEKMCRSILRLLPELQERRRPSAYRPEQGEQ